MDPDYYYPMQWSPIQQSMPSVYIIHQTGKPAVVNLGVNTNPDISATCTGTAGGNVLPLYLIYPESQIKHATVKIIC